MMSQQTEQPTLFQYKTPFLLNALMEGAHKSKRQGPGSEFYRKTAFLADPNPARVDLARSLMDPFETLYVKSFRQRSELDVVTLADGSHSMLTGDKSDFLVQALDCICRSVFEGNDKPHNYLLAESTLAQPPRPDWQAAIEALHHNTSPQTAKAFMGLQHEIPRQRSLVFVLSDFHWPADCLQSVMSALSAHLVVPVVIWSSTETADYPLWRFIQVQDAESANQHLLFMTPKQRMHIKQSFSERVHYLNSLFNAHGYRPIWLSKPFSAQQFDRYFLGE